MEIDLRGLKCPLPVLRTRKRLASLPENASLAVLSDDPLAAIDIPHFCHGNGHRLVSAERVGTAMRFVIERGADGAQPKE